MSYSFLAKFPFILRKNTGKKVPALVQNISVRIVKTCLSQISRYTWNTFNKSTPLMELNSFQSNGNDPARQAVTLNRFLSWQPFAIAGRRRPWSSVWWDHRPEKWQSQELQCSLCPPAPLPNKSSRAHEKSDYSWELSSSWSMFAQTIFFAISEMCKILPTQPHWS